MSEPIPPPRFTFPPLRRLIVPFFLLSALMSLPLNLAREKRLRKEQLQTLETQISVLSRLVDRSRDTRSQGILSDRELEKELGLVGLGNEAREREELARQAGSLTGRKIGWKEVFFGNKERKEREKERARKEEEKIDWEKVFNEAVVEDSAKDVQKVNETYTPPQQTKPDTPLPPRPPPGGRRPAQHTYL